MRIQLRQILEIAAFLFVGLEFVSSEKSMLKIVGIILLIACMFSAIGLLMPWKKLIKKFLGLFRIQRKLSVILFTDIIGYTAIKAQDEQKARHLLVKNRHILQPLIRQFNGKWLKETVDCTISSFESVIDAANCALEVQRTLTIDSELTLRIGIHSGEVWFVQDNVLGDGVNVADGIELFAEPGGICISESVYDIIRNYPGIETDFLAEKTLKNVDHPVKVYTLKGSEGYTPIPGSFAIEHKEPSHATRSFNWIILAAAGVTAVIVGYTLYFHFSHKETTMQGTPIPVMEQIQSIAVLPFADMSPDKDHEYFCDGIAEEILNKLTHVEGLRVIARTSSFGFKNQQKPIFDLCKELGVGWLLEGSVRKADKDLRITAQLIKVSDQSHIFSEIYEYKLKDVFDIQEKISLSILNELKINLLRKDKASIEKRGTDNFEAYELYLFGRHHWKKRDEEGFIKALQSFNQAIDIDPKFAHAYAGKADVYNIMGFRAIMSPKDAYPEAKKATNTALKIDNSLADAHVSLAWTKLYYDWDWSAAESEFKRALELNPNCVSAHLWYKDCLLVMGQFDDAVTVMERCHELDPLSEETIKFLIVTYIIAGRYDEAMKQFNKAKEIYSNRPFLYDIMSKLYFQQGKYDEAIAYLEKAKELSGEDSYQEAIFGLIYAFSGDKDLATPILRKLIVRYEMNKYSPSRIALYYVGMGENDKAFDWLEKAYEEHDSQLVYINTFPEWKSIHSEPKFKDLLKRIGFE